MKGDPLLEFQKWHMSTLHTCKVLAHNQFKMMGGSEAVSGDKDGVPTTAIHVPIGWQRRVEDGHVIYVR